MSAFFDDLEQRLRESAAEQPWQEHAAEPRAAERRTARQRAPRPRRRGLFALVVAVLVAGAAVPGVPAVTGLWQPDADPGRPWGTVTGARGVTCERSTPRFRAGPPIGPEFAAVLGVFARPRTAADRFERKYLRSLRLIGADPNGIRRAGVDATGRDVFLVPAQGLGEAPWPARCVRRAPPEQRDALAHPPQVREPVVCVIGGGGGSCGRLSDIAAHGTYGSSGVVRGRATISGLAPNGVEAVRVTYGRSTRSFPVRDNFFSFKLGLDVERAHTPDRLEWVMPDGSVRDVTR